MNYDFEDKDAINQPLLFHSMSTDDDESIHATRKCSPSSRSKWFAVPAVEDQGIKPVSENERTHTRIIDNFTFWFSIASNVLTMALGVLGVHLFGLDFKVALGCIVLANLINSLPGAFFITMGHRLGMRQIIITRYAYGYAGSRGVAVTNILSSIGWSILNSIQAGQLLVALMSSIPLAAAILIMSFITVTVAIFGYAVLHHFERWAWIPTWISILIMLATSATKLSTTTPTSSSSSNDIGAIISYATIIYSAPSIWSTSAADFTVKQSTRFDSRYVAFLSYAGGVIPVILLETFGLILATTALSGQEGWEDANDVGGLIHAALSPLGIWGNILIGILALSTITHNIPNAYGLGLMLQNLFPSIQHWIFTLAGVCIYTTFAIAGSEHLYSLFQNLLPFMTYFYGPYVIILILEHFYFRQGSFKQYSRDAWNQADLLPQGIAAWSATLLGYFSAFLGIKQPWYVGPLAQVIGVEGGDVGVPIAMVVAAATYIPLRKIERKRGRK